MFLFGPSLGSNSILLIIKDLDSVNLEVLSYNVWIASVGLLLCFLLGIGVWETETNEALEMAMVNNELSHMWLSVVSFFEISAGAGGLG